MRKIVHISGSTLWWKMGLELSLPVARQRTSRTIAHKGGATSQRGEKQSWG